MSYILNCFSFCAVKLVDEVFDRLVHVAVHLHHVVEYFEADALHVALKVIRVLNEFEFGRQCGILEQVVTVLTRLLLVLFSGLNQLSVLIVELGLFGLNQRLQLGELGVLVRNHSGVFLLLLSSALGLLLDLLSAVEQILVLGGLLLQLLSQVFVLLIDQLLLRKQLLSFLSLLSVQTSLQTLERDVVLSFALLSELLAAHLSLALLLQQFLFPLVQEIVGLTHTLNLHLHHLNLNFGLLDLLLQFFLLLDASLQVRHVEPILVQLLHSLLQSLNFRLLALVIG